MNLPSPIEDICAAYDSEGNQIILRKPEKEVLKQIHRAYENVDSKRRPYTFKQNEIRLTHEGQLIFNELLEVEYSIRDKNLNYEHKMETVPENSNNLSELEQENIIQLRKSQATFYQIFNVKNKVNLKLITFDIEEVEPVENKLPYTLESGTKVFPLNAYIEKNSIHEYDCPVFHIPLEKKSTLDEFHHTTYSKHQT